MMSEDSGWRPWQVIPRLAGGVVAVPVVVGFVALGAVVLVVRSVRDVARDARSWVEGRGTKVPPATEKDSHAA